MKNKKKAMYFALGLQFTSSIILPPVVCVFLGMYLQGKYKLGDWVMGVSVALAAVMMFASLYGFAKSAIDISRKQNSQSEDEVNTYELRKQRRN